MTFKELKKLASNKGCWLYTNNSQGVLELHTKDTRRIVVTVYYKTKYSFGNLTKENAVAVIYTTLMHLQCQN